MIPVLDCRDAAAPEAAVRARFAAALLEALREWGFVGLRGHGVPLALVRETRAHFERFFSLDDAEKARCGGVAGGQRGYTPFGAEHAKDSRLADLKEFFHVGRYEPSEQTGYPANRWPEEPRALRPAAEALFEALERCAITLLQSLALGLSLPEDVFASGVIGGNHILRAAHYPAVSAEQRASGALRAAPHEDINLVTLLPEASDSGLEIRTRDRWWPVDVEEGVIVADGGDMLMRMTGGVLPATTHRVVLPREGGGARTSLPFFAHPRPEFDLSVIPRLVPAGSAPRFPSITAGEFLAERLREIGLLEG